VAVRLVKVRREDAIADETDRAEEIVGLLGKQAELPPAQRGPPAFLAAGPAAILSIVGTAWPRSGWARHHQGGGSLRDRAEGGGRMDENDHPKGALLFMLVYLVLMAGLWANAYLRLWGG